MSLALKVYEAFKDDQAKAQVLSEAFDFLETNFAHKGNVVAFPDLNQRGLELTIELEKVRKEIKEVEGKLSREIKEVEGKLSREIKEVEGKLSREIKEVEGKLFLEIKEVEGRLSKEIKEVEGRLLLKIEEVRSDLLKSMNRQIIWVLGSMAGFAAILKALDYFLK